MQEIRAYLLKNGFRCQDNQNQFFNDVCRVSLKEDHYMVTKMCGEVLYCSSLNLYGLIGVLLSHGYLNDQYRTALTHSAKNCNQNLKL